MDDRHRILPQVPWVSLALSLSIACAPPPKSVGDEALETGGDPTAGSDDGSGDALDPDAPLWSYVLPADVMIARMVGMPDGGVTTIAIELEMNQQWVTRYSPAGDVLWEVDVGSTWLYTIAALPDGRVVVGGAQGQGPSASVWRLSPAGAVEATYTHPLLEDGESNRSVSEIEATGTGIAYVVQNRGVDAGTPLSELWWADLELVPQWSWGGSHDIDGLAILPSGELLTLEEESPQDGTDRMRTFSPAGAPMGEQVVPRGRFADDQPLVKFEDLDDLSTRLVGLGGTSTIDVALPGFPVAATYGNGVAVVSLLPSSGEGMRLVQLDAAGVELRTVIRSPLQEEVVVPLDVVIAPDGAVYVVGYEKTPVEDPSYGFILKLPPP